MPVFKCKYRCVEKPRIQFAKINIQADGWVEAAVLALQRIEKPAPGEWELLKLSKIPEPDTERNQVWPKTISSRRNP